MRVRVRVGVPARLSAYRSTVWLLAAVELDTLDGRTSRSRRNSSASRETLSA